MLSNAVGRYPQFFLERDGRHEFIGLWVQVEVRCHHDYFFFLIRVQLLLTMSRFTCTEPERGVRFACRSACCQPRHRHLRDRFCKRVSYCLKPTNEPKTTYCTGLLCRCSFDSRNGKALIEGPVALLMVSLAVLSVLQKALPSCNHKCKRKQTSKQTNKTYTYEAFAKACFPR